MSESIVRWTLDVIQSVGQGDRHRDLTAVPIEILNVLIPLKEIVDNEPLVDSLLERLCRDVSDFGYFEIITFLFLLGHGRRHRDLKKALFSRAKAIVIAGISPSSDSSAAHLSLDLLACPFLPLDKRASWFNQLRSTVSLPGVATVEARTAVEALASSHWFTHWDKVDLLAMLRKKELSAVY